ncbi:hypothetical protein [Streptomyces paradoxus]
MVAVQLDREHEGFSLVAVEEKGTDVRRAAVLHRPEPVHSVDDGHRLPVNHDRRQFGAHLGERIDVPWVLPDSSE